MFAGAIVIGLCFGADAATIIVQPGQTIASGISQASAGDTVFVKAGTYSGFNLNKAVTVRGERVLGGALGVTLTSTVSISANNCTVDGFYVNGAGIHAYNRPTSGFSPSNVKVLNNHTYNTNFHCWISGSNWLVQGNKFERVRHSGGDGDADYSRMFGSGHVVRGNHFFGTSYGWGLDIEPNGPHTDCIQFYGNNGGVLHDIVIERNFFTDIFQGLFLADEQSASDIRNLTIRDNVFWGQPMPNTGNMNGRPSWGIRVGKNGGSQNVLIEHNLIYNCANYIGLYAGADATLRRNIIASSTKAGTVYNIDGSSAAIEEMGSVLYNYNYIGKINPSTNIKSNPLMRNPLNPLGGDGKPLTWDDGWLPMGNFAKAYGPRLVLDTDQDLLPDEMEVTVTLTDPNDPDTDGDGVLDGTEHQMGYDPLDANGFPILGVDPAILAVLVAGVLGVGTMYLKRRGGLARVRR